MVKQIVDPQPVTMDAPEDQRPAGMICEPVGDSGGEPVCEMPCPQVETTHYDANQPRAMSRKESQESLKWPKVEVMYRCPFVEKTVLFVFCLTLAWGLD